MTEISREALSENLINELAPLVARNWEESGGYAGLPLKVFWEMYLELEDTDILDVFVARNENEEVSGYLMYMTAGGHPHSKDYPFGIQDAFYVAEWARKGGGLAIKLMEFAELYLHEAGVEVITQTAKPGSSFNDVLLRRGFEHTDNTYVKRI